MNVRNIQKVMKLFIFSPNDTNIYLWSLPCKIHQSHNEQWEIGSYKINQHSEAGTNFIYVPKTYLAKTAYVGKTKEIEA